MQLDNSLRLAWRGLRRTPGTSAGAVLTLGVSFVAVVVLLGVLQGARRALPVPGGEEIVRLELRDAAARSVPFPSGPAAAWAQGHGLEAVGGIAAIGGTLVRDGFPALRTSGAAMEPAVFPLLGVPPARGRWPGDAPEDAGTLVLGWDVFLELGGTDDLLGAQVRLDGAPRTVVGVMPDGFGFPEKQSFWTVLGRRDSLEQVVARLADGVQLEGARSALDLRARALPVARGHAGPYRANVRPWNSGRGEGGEALAFAGLAVLVALLVVICAANVSTLLLVRAAERAGTLAVHAALGASRSQVAAVLLLEALLVSLAGGVVGVLGGAAALHWIETSLAQHWGYYWMRMELQAGTIAGALAAVVLAALLAGTAPAVRASRIDLREVLAGNGRGGSGRRQRWLGRWFVWAQVTLSTIGLVAALLLGTGMRRLGTMTSGLPLDEIAIGQVTPGDRYREPAARARLIEALRAELARVAGASAATVTGSIPGLDYTGAPLRLIGDTVTAAALPRTHWLGADGGMLETYGVRLLRGRNLDARDDAAAPAVALVTASFAARYFAGSDAIGARVQLDGVHAEGVYAEVVGIVADWHPEHARGGQERVILPIAQAPRGTLTLSLRSRRPAEILGSIRAAVARVDGEIAVESPQTLRSFTAWLLRMPRVLAGFGILGGITGVLVAAIGLYGVLAFQVRSRLSEMGVRMALGAAPARILGVVLREALVRVLPGVAVGGVIAGGAVQLLGFLTAGANARSPLLFLAALAIMLGVALLASLQPALRAARTDPLAIIRRE